VRLKVRATGKGTEDDPIRPDLSTIPEIANLHKALDKYRKTHKKEITDITFYTVQVINYDEKNEQFEVEIKVNKDALDKLPDEIKSILEKL